MKNVITIILFSCVITLSLAGLLYAGALDRQNVQPRTNEATQSMIRVPGVVGQDSAYAMSSLQQAGLNVSVLEAKKMPKGMEGATNMEGKVVSQTPNPGGMAMYGTTVNIYVWKPNESPSAGSEMPAGNSWDTGNYSTNNQTQSTYSGTQTQPQPQMYQQQMGTTGTSTQQSQPFQVQQYYYPPAGDASASSNQQDQTNQGQQTTDPNTYQQPVDPNASQPTADPNTYQQPADPNASQATSDPNAFQQPADPNAFQQPADPNASQQTVDPNAQQPSEGSKKHKSSKPTEQQTSTPAQ